MKKLLCKIFGHKYEDNHTSQPTRLWCNRCDKKWEYSINTKSCHPNELIQWVEVSEFKNSPNKLRALSGI